MPEAAVALPQLRFCECGQPGEYIKDGTRFCFAHLETWDQAAEAVISDRQRRGVERFEAALRVACDPGPWVRGDT